MFSQDANRLSNNRILSDTITSRKVTKKKTTVDAPDAWNLKILQLNRSLYFVSPASPTFATSVASEYERCISSLSQRTSDDIILSAALQYSKYPSRSRLNSFTAKKTINNKPNYFYRQWLRSFALIVTKSKKLPGNEHTPSSPYGNHFGNNLGVDCKSK